MGKKQHFLIVDTESTIEDHVADFGACVVDRQGNILTKCAVLTADFRHEPLFFDEKSSEEIWTVKGLQARTENYARMLQSGQRMIASVGAINRWLERALMQYQPELTAYNLAFDTRICQNSGIDLSIFHKRFCLWQAAVGNLAKSKTYRKFCLDNHLFGNRTEKGNMTIKTNAEVMSSYVAGEMLPAEPHTAIEDAIHYELPILLKVLKKAKWRERITPYNWRDFAVRDAYEAK